MINNIITKLIDMVEMLIKSASKASYKGILLVIVILNCLSVSGLYLLPICLLSETDSIVTSLIIIILFSASYINLITKIIPFITETISDIKIRTLSSHGSKRNIAGIYDVSSLMTLLQTVALLAFFHGLPILNICLALDAVKQKKLNRNKAMINDNTITVKNSSNNTRNSIVIDTKKNRCDDLTYCSYIGCDIIYTDKVFGLKLCDIHAAEARKCIGNNDAILNLSKKIKCES